MKTKEELNALKNEMEALNKKLAELAEEELEQVNGGDQGYSWDNIRVDRRRTGTGAGGKN